VILTSGGNAYHERKAIINPNQAKKKTLPYLLMGLRIGIDRAFLLTGLISGACHRVATLKPMVDEVSGAFSMYWLDFC
jgi:hypothetical protein